MSDALSESDDRPPASSLAGVLAGLAAAEADVAALTGGAETAAVLAELALSAARELAQYFDTLSNPASEAAVAQGTGWRRWFSSTRRVRHRLLLVRYQFAEPAEAVGVALISTDVRGYVLALGADGELRVGFIEETLLLDVGTELPVQPLSFTDDRTRNVPSDRVRLDTWSGGNDPEQVAPAEIVMEALRLAALLLHEQVLAQGALLRRLLETETRSTDRSRLDEHRRASQGKT